MARTIGKLTVLRIRQLKKPGLYADGGNLYLQVGKTAGKAGSTGTRLPASK